MIPTPALTPLPPTIFHPEHALSSTPLHTPAQAHSVICNLLISTCTLISTLQDLVAALDIVPYAKESLNHKMSWCSKRCRMSCHDIMPLCHFGLFHLQVHERLCRSDGLWTIKNHPGQTLRHSRKHHQYLALVMPMCNRRSARQKILFLLLSTNLLKTSCLAPCILALVRDKT